MCSVILLNIISPLSFFVDISYGRIIIVALYVKFVFIVAALVDSKRTGAASAPKIASRYLYVIFDIFIFKDIFYPHHFVHVEGDENFFSVKNRYHFITSVCFGVRQTFL